jgi:hypothetical protein
MPNNNISTFFFYIVLCLGISLVGVAPADTASAQCNPSVSRC